MSQLLKNLFELLDSPQSAEEEARAVKAAEEAVQAAEQRLTYEEFENLWNAIMNIGCVGHLDSFTLGFRLGVQLTPEGLRPI